MCKCYEYKLNTELLKTCVSAMTTLEYVISHEIVVWIFCCQKIWMTQASNLEVTKKIMVALTRAQQELHKVEVSESTSSRSKSLEGFTEQIGLLIQLNNTQLQ